MAGKRIRSEGSVPSVHLLAGNVLVASTVSGPAHHLPAQRWFGSNGQPFATCPMTQGPLMRLLIRLGQAAPETALQVLQQPVSHPRHRFWPDSLGYADIYWRGVIGHRQVTDAYLAALARHHGAKVASCDRGFGF